MSLTADDNIILMTDSYKISHFKQYPEGTESVYSYFESRGGKYPQTAFFGLQYLMMKHLEGVRVTKANIDEAELVTKSHFPPGTVFNRAGWEHIVEKHGGRLPIAIKAVPEGTVVDTKNVLMTIENTDPKCYWLTNYIETLLVQIWYPTTVATHSRACKKVILDALRKSGDPELVQFKLQDFGFRGVSSVETAGIGGAAHLVNFMGTDTVAGIVMANRVYGVWLHLFLADLKKTHYSTQRTHTHPHPHRRPSTPPPARAPATRSPPRNTRRSRRGAGRRRATRWRTCWTSTPTASSPASATVTTSSTPARRSGASV